MVFWEAFSFASLEGCNTSLCLSEFFEMARRDRLVNEYPNGHRVSLRGAFLELFRNGSSFLEVRVQRLLLVYIVLAPIDIGCPRQGRIAFTFTIWLFTLSSVATLAASHPVAHPFLKN